MSNKSIETIQKYKNYTDEQMEELDNEARKKLAKSMEEIRKTLNYKTTSQKKREKENQNLVCGIVSK